MKKILFLMALVLMLGLLGCDPKPVEPVDPDREVNAVIRNENLTGNHLSMRVELSRNFEKKSQLMEVVNRVVTDVYMSYEGTFKNDPYTIEIEFYFINEGSESSFGTISFYVNRYQNSPGLSLGLDNLDVV